MYLQSATTRENHSAAVLFDFSFAFFDKEAQQSRSHLALTPSQSNLLADSGTSNPYPLASATAPCIDSRCCAEQVVKRTEDCDQRKKQRRAESMGEVVRLSVSCSVSLLFPPHACSTVFLHFCFTGQSFTNRTAHEHEFLWDTADVNTRSTSPRASSKKYTMR